MSDLESGRAHDRHAARPVNDHAVVHAQELAGHVAAALDRHAPDDPDEDSGRRSGRVRVDRLQLLVEHAAADRRSADAARLYQPGAGHGARSGCHPLPPAQARATDLRPAGGLPHRDPTDPDSRGHQQVAPSAPVDLVLGLPGGPLLASHLHRRRGGHHLRTRVLWRQKLAIAFLFLAWPYPYEKYLLGVLNAFTNATVAAMEKIAAWTHLATPLVGSDNAVFSVTHHGTPFTLSIVSACSGVNSVVGFLLVGSAFAAIVRGPIVRKVLWLFGGMVLLWALNIGRLTFIFFAGKEWGESIAINVFHPFVGLVLFSLGVIVMIALIRPLGMHIRFGSTSAVGSPVGAASHASAASSPESAKGSKAPLAVPKVSLAVVAVVVAALVVGVSDVGLRSYNLVADVSGQAKLDTFIQGPVAPAGWSAQYETTYGWAKPLFGDTSIWNRYVVHSLHPNPLSTSAVVVADVINTRISPASQHSELRSFSNSTVMRSQTSPKCHSPAE